MKNSPNRKGIKSVEISSNILIVLSECRFPMRLKDLSEVLKIPPARVHSYLVSLCNVGFVFQNGKSGRYQIGPKMLKFGFAALSQNRLYTIVEDAVDGLYEDTGLTVVMAVWNSSGPVVVRWRHGLETLSVNTSLGSNLPLLTTAIGRVFLSFSPMSATEKLISAEKKALADSPFFSMLAEETKIQQIISEVKVKGYSRISGILSPRMAAYAAPVYSETGKIFAAIGIIDENGFSQPEKSEFYKKKLLRSVDITSLGISGETN